MNLDKAIYFSVSLHIAFFLGASTYNGWSPPDEQLTYTVEIVTAEQKQEINPPKTEEEINTPTNRQRTPPQKKIANDSKWLKEAASKRSIEKAKAYENARMIKQRRLREARELVHETQVKDQRIREIKEQARVQAIRKQAASAGAQPTREVTKGQRNIIMAEYTDRIMAIIKKNWNFTLSDEDETRLLAEVAVTIKSTGALIIEKVEKSSGDRAFDRSVLKAINKTGRVEPPPFKRDEEVVLRFQPEQ